MSVRWCATVGALAAAAFASPASADAGRYVVVLHDRVDEPGRVAAEHARTYGAEVGHVYRAALRGYSATIPSRRLAALRADGRVDFVAEDRAHSVAAQSLPTGVDRVDGELSTARAGDGSGAVGTAVAVIDTGIDVRHPDLNVVGGKNCSTGTSYNDGNGHGSHVAGSVAARDDGNGVVGVAPGAPLYAVRVLNNAGSGSTSSVVCGIDWVTANAGALGIRVANMSLGGGGADDGNCGNSNNDPEHKAICASVARGVTYVVAAGNSNVDFKGSIPAAYDEVLTVSALADFNGRPGGGAAATCRADVDETAADFSNFTTVGSLDAGHTIAAPGVCIHSTWKGGGYNTISGTSMASPHVAGAAALCIATSALTGKCTGGPGDVIADLRADAAAQPAGYGFAQDPHRVNTAGSRHYGYLAWAGGL